MNTKSKRPLIFLFGGQGSQYYNLGKSLYENNRTFKKYMDECSDYLKEIRPDLLRLTEELYNEKNKKIFSDLFYTHPAILITEYSLFKVLEAEGITPDFVLGSSLGEYTASVVSGACNIKDMIKVVMNHAEAVVTQCRKGGMTAVLESVDLFDDLSNGSDITIAGANFNKHFTVSGDPIDLSDFEGRLKEKEILYFRLPVDYAFHSERIDEAEMQFTKAISDINFKRPEIGMLSGLDGNMLDGISPEYLWNVTRYRMDIMNVLKKLEKESGATYIDLTPNGTFANFVRYNLPPDSSSSYHGIFSAFNIELQNIEKLKLSLGL